MTEFTDLTKWQQTWVRIGLIDIRRELEKLAYDSRPNMRPGRTHLTITRITGIIDAISVMTDND